MFTKYLSQTHRTSPRRLYGVRSSPVSTRHAPGQCSSVQCELLLKGAAHNCTARGAKRSLSRALLFAGLPLTAAPVSCTPLHSVVIHCTSLRYIRSPTALTRYGRAMIHHTATANSHNLHSLPAQGSFHSIPFHSFTLSLSRPQSTRCPCCARLRCRPGCGLS